MKNLKLPNIDNEKLWESIVEHRHIESRIRLKIYKNQVINRYDYYKSNFTSLDKIKPLVSGTWSSIKDELISLYGKNVEFNKVKKELLNTVQCPYCSLSRPNTLDHYFDKSEYPEYSVYVPNLVPCCSECNGLKNSTVFDSNGRRLFIHFYLDNLPNYKFLFVRFLIVNRVPEITISFSFKESEQMKDIIEAHFLKLNLFEKYKEVIGEKITTVIDEIQLASKFGETIEQIRNSFKYRCQALANRFGENYWETCMYEGVLSNVDFFDFYYNN